MPRANGLIAYSVAPEDKTRTDDVPGVSRIESSLPDGTRRVAVSAAKGSDREGAEYSPDGKRIAWAASGRKATKRDGVYVAAGDGTGARRVAKTSWTEDLAWSPDGRTIVYPEVGVGVFSVPADGSAAPKKLLDDPEDGGWYRRPTFSPDGQTIVLEHDTMSDNVDGKEPWLVSAVLMRIDPDGSGLAPLLPAGVAPKLAGEPDFSPDGKTIVFATVGKPKQGATLVLHDVATARDSILRRVKKGELSKPTWQPLPLG